MNITATLLGQMITFAILIWFVQRYLWVPLLALMADRTRRVADGLAAAERGLREQALAEQRAKEILHQAHQKADEIIAQAHKRGSEIEDEAKQKARIEGERLIVAAQADIAQQLTQAKEALRLQVAELALAGAEKILHKEIDANVHRALLNQLASEL